MSPISNRQPPRDPDAGGGPLILSVGHSTHPIAQFIALLKRHRVELVADVRSFPSSRRWPQFNQEALASSLKGAGVGYRWLKPLGGRRHQVSPDSPHRAWQHPAFRSYADYAESGEFALGIEDLRGMASEWMCAFMCSEGLWWRCHRRIISDHLILAGWRVMHIMPSGDLVEHRLPEFARVERGRIIYDGNQPSLL